MQVQLANELASTCYFAKITLQFYTTHFFNLCPLKLLYTVVLFLIYVALILVRSFSVKSWRLSIYIEDIIKHNKIQ